MKEENGPPYSKFFVFYLPYDDLLKILLADLEDETALGLLIIIL